MKLATFTHGGSTRIGLVDGDAILDLAAADPDLPREMIAFLEAGQGALEAADAPIEPADLARELVIARAHLLAHLRDR